MKRTFLTIFRVYNTQWIASDASKKFVLCSDRRPNDRFCHSVSGKNNQEELHLCLQWN